MRHGPGTLVTLLLMSAALPAASQPALVLDSDGDGLTDDREAFLGTDPSLADSDGDGFDDGFEHFYREFGFDPTRFDRDRDRDGLTDELENHLGTSSTSADSDGDGLADLDEVWNARYGFDPLAPTEDADFDGLADGLEERIGTDPRKADGDGDGASDFAEVRAGTDPLARDERFGERLGDTLSPALRGALEDLQRLPPDQRAFPWHLIDEVPFSEVLGRHLARGIEPSAALLQQAAANPALAASLARDLYRSYPEVVSILRAIAEAHPDVAALFEHPSLRTVAGNALYVMKISDNVGTNEEDEEEILYMALHHARELVTVEVALGFIQELVGSYGVKPEITALVDAKEIWIVPVVNPDGYERVLGGTRHLSGQEWRKNARVLTLVHAASGEVEHQIADGAGIDLNRNYGWMHMSTIPAERRADLRKPQAVRPDADQTSNGLWGDGHPAGRLATDFDVDSQTFPGPGPFSERETTFVRQLVEVRTTGRTARDGFRCSLSWHSYGGEVLYPWGYTNAAAPDQAALATLAEEVADATGYVVSHPYRYKFFGDSGDWLYGAHDILALTVETYGKPEGNRRRFYPLNPKDLDNVVSRNVKGAIAFAEACGDDLDDGSRAADPGGDFFRHFAGTPADAHPWLDIRDARAIVWTREPHFWTDYRLPSADGAPEDLRVLTMEMELYEPVPAVPAAEFASWHFVVDLDGRADTGHPGGERPVGVFPELGVDLWADLIWDGARFRPFLFLGAEGIRFLIDTPGLVKAWTSDAGRRVTLEVPVAAVEEILRLEYGGNDFAVDDEWIEWVAVTNHVAGPLDFEDPPSDFFPDWLYLPEGACERSPGALCLGEGGRFAVQATWRTADGAAGMGHPVPLTADTGTFWFFHPDNVELLIKVLDACAPFGRFWVFAGGLTNVEVEIAVTDTETGEVRTYSNPQGAAFLPLQDTGAFDACGTAAAAPGAATSAALAATRAPAETAPMPLNGGRFAVEVSWETSQGTSGAGQPLPLTADTGTFWFFHPDNLELVVKVLDACAPFGRYWVFAGGLTDVGVEIVVTDTATGESRRYTNQTGTAFLPIQDTDAFATCP